MAEIKTRTDRIAHARNHTLGSDIAKGLCYTGMGWSKVCVDERVARLLSGKDRFHVFDENEEGLCLVSMITPFKTATNVYR